jgi:hypothetical protein
MIEKCKNLQGDTNFVWIHAKIIFNSLYQSGGARCYDARHAPLRPTCLCKGRLPSEICASQVSRNHVKLSERVIGGKQGGLVQLCNFRSIFTYYLISLMI